MDVPLSDLASLEGRVAVITGAGRGIGAAIALRFAEAGARLVLVDKDVPESPPEGAVTITGDLRAPGVIERTVTAAVEGLGGLDVWVNNAGIYPAANVVDLGDDEWDAVLDLNLRAAFRGARAAARAMVDAGRGGVIINIVSNAAVAAGPATAHYVASKHGLAGLTKSLAVDLGKAGIRAVGIAPGVTRTEGIAARMAELRDAGWGDVEAYVARSVPLGRMADADEIARVAVFAASDLAAYVTGTTIVVDGGQVTSFS